MTSRFILIGRRGAGKSSLVNAIFGAKIAEIGSVKSQTGKPKWYEYHNVYGRIEILDTRGVQEGSSPTEWDPNDSPEASILSECEQKWPDIALFLCKGKEVDSGIKADIEVFEYILQKLADKHGQALPVVGLVTQCDELDPPDIRQLPTDDQEKNRNIKAAVKQLEKQFNSTEYIRRNFARIIPVATFCRYKNDGSIDPNRDYRWNIDVLLSLLLDELPRETHIHLARLAKIRNFQKKVATNVVHMFSATCGIIGAEPIPIADLPVLTGLQTALVVVIGYISGREMTLDTAKEFMAAVGINVGAGYALREVARGLLKFFPGYGNVISGTIAAAGTEAIGNAAIKYFIDQEGHN